MLIVFIVVSVVVALTGNAKHFVFFPVEFRLPLSALLACHNLLGIHGGSVKNLFLFLNQYNSSKCSPKTLP